MISISFALGPTLVTIYTISKTVFGHLYPIAQSCRAILDRNAEGYHQWLTYWMVFFCMRFIEGVVDLFFSRLPGYRFFKLAFIIWLVLPRFKGAALIYHGLIHKHLEYYERDIDGHLVRISKRAQETAWTVGQAVVKETSTVVARAATSMVISPTAASLIQQTAANGGVVGSGEGAAGTFNALSAATAFAGAMGAASLSCSSSSRPARPSHIEVDDAFGQPPPRPPQQQDTLQRPSSWTHRPSPSSSRLSRNLPSPIGATQTQLLADIVKILEDGIFVHISTAINHNTNQQASPKPVNLSVTSLHLLRLSTQRRALIYDQVSNSCISTLPLLRILAVRAGSSDTALELVHLPTSIISEGGEEEEEEEKEVDSESFWKGKRKESGGGGGGMTRVLLINVETPGDRDLLLTGFVMMMRKAREPYQLGSRRLRLCLLRHFLKRWKTCAGEGRRIEDEEKEGRGKGWEEKGRGEEEMTEVEEEEDGRSHVSSSSTDNDMREWISSSDEKSPEKSR